MHNRLLHEALQKEETRAIVIEVEEELEALEGDEEFYAANFEVLGQDDEEEEEGMDRTRERCLRSTPRRTDPVCVSKEYR